MEGQSSNLQLTEPLQCTNFFRLITVPRTGRSQVQVHRQISFHDKSCDRGEFPQIQVIAAPPMHGYWHAICGRWLSGSETSDGFRFNEFFKVFSE
jgi:hypothetical protein